MENAIKYFLDLDDSKRRIKFFYSLRILLTVILSAKLYETFIGDYKLIPISNYEELINYFIKGNVFLCLTIYGAVWFIGYEILEIFLYFINNKFSNRRINSLKKKLETIPSYEDAFAPFVHKIFMNSGIAQSGEERNKLRPGKDFKIYRALLENVKINPGLLPKETIIKVEAFSLQLGIFYFIDLNGKLVFWPLWINVIIAVLFFLILPLLFSIFYTVFEIILAMNDWLLDSINKIKDRQLVVPKSTLVSRLIFFSGVKPPRWLRRIFNIKPI